MSKNSALPRKPQALPPATRFRDFEDKEQKTPSSTLWNARVALAKLSQRGLQFTYDMFRSKYYAGGMALSSDAGQVHDEALSAIRVMIRDQFNFDPGKNNTWDALLLTCRERGYHPVKDYLEPLWWDHVERINTMLIDYFGAPDTEFIRGVSRMVMVASVRRIYEPGCKYDYMVVLESVEGMNKSSALATLYGAQFFSDQTILGLDDKHLQETVRGRWCIEAADLSGMRKSEVDKVKAQLSRFEDRSRPAYGRAVIDAPRSVVFWGTTNEHDYLRSQTGNRRFLPVPVGRINVEALKRDRDQLWAEAYEISELSNESILLPERLWTAAGIEQDARRKIDPWEDALVDLGPDYPKGGREIVERGDGRVIERVSSEWLMSNMLCIPLDRRNAELASRLRTVMYRLGWSYNEKTMRIGGKPTRGYWREVEAWEQ